MAEVTWYALFTGIDDYADDTLDIRGAVNDAKAWYAFARRLGLPADRIVMCTSPALTAADLGDGAKGAQFFAADHAGANAACDALCAMLDGNPDARTLLTWTGHASSVAVEGDERGTLLAVSDTDAADGKTMIPLQSLIERIDNAVYTGERDPQGADASVLAMIDVCHASAPAVTTYDGVTGDRTLAGCGAVALTATKPGELAHVIDIGGEQRGAFSWAVTTLLERFGFDDGASRLTPAELYYRSRELLGAIDARQTPVLFSVTGELNRRLMHGLNADARGAGVADLGDPLEIYPDWNGSIKRFRIVEKAGSSDGTLYGHFYISGKPVANSLGWKSDTNYWQWDGSYGPTGSPSTFYLKADSGDFKPVDLGQAPGAGYKRADWSSASPGALKNAVCYEMAIAGQPGLLGVMTYQAGTSGAYSFWRFAATTGASMVTGNSVVVSFDYNSDFTGSQSWVQVDDTLL